jgi:hypothetical protein
MTNEQKGVRYSQLMMEHTHLQNKVAEIKGQSIELNEQQRMEIKELQQKMIYLFNLATKLY